MNQGKYIFSQIMGLVSYKQFKTIVNRNFGDYNAKDFTCWKQYLCMAFGQLSHREIFSGTLKCLKVNAHKRYHPGIGELVANSTLTRANENCSYRIFEEFAMLLSKQAKHEAIILGARPFYFMASPLTSHSSGFFFQLSNPAI
ncbi:hypothetical protein BH10BAC2_BH10BAC2_20510 [soil metagenome]